jgi:hypothetical protein
VYGAEELALMGRFYSDEKEVTLLKGIYGGH